MLEILITYLIFSCVILLIVVANWIADKLYIDKHYPEWSLKEDEDENKT